MATGSERPEKTSESGRKPPSFASVLLPVAVILAVVLVVLGYVRTRGDGAHPGGAADSAAAPDGRREVGRALPDVELTSIDGKRTRLSELPGKVVLVNFWATWCGPCVSELPALQKLADEYRSRGLTVVGVNVDEDWEKVLEPFRKKHGITFPSYVDPKGELSDRFDVSGLPLTLVYGPGRKLLLEKLGEEEWFDDVVRKQFEKWLDDAGKAGGA